MADSHIGQKDEIEVVQMAGARFTHKREPLIARMPDCFACNREPQLHRTKGI